MKFNKKEAEIVCKEYDLGKFKKLKLFDIGVVNYNYSIKTNKGNFVVRVLTRKPKIVEMNVLEHLGKKNLPYKIPIPIKNRKGKYFFEINSNNNLWVYRFIEGKKPSKNFLRKNFYKFAKILALYHKAISDFRVKEKGESLFDKKLVESYKKLSRKFSKNRYDKLFKENVNFFITEMNNLKGYKIKYRTLMNHNDLHPENVLIKNNKIVGIIDFDNLTPAPRVFDVSRTMTEFCLKENWNGVNEKKAKKFIKEYEKINKLTKEEKELLILIRISYQPGLFRYLYIGMKKGLNKKYNWMKHTVKLAKGLRNQIDLFK